MRGCHVSIKQVLVPGKMLASLTFQSKGIEGPVANPRRLDSTNKEVQLCRYYNWQLRVPIETSSFKSHFRNLVSHHLNQGCRAFIQN